MQNTRYSYQILIKREFSQHIFEKYSNTEFHEKVSGRSRVLSCGRKAGQADVTNTTVAFHIFFQAHNSHFPQVYESLYSAKKYFTTVSFHIPASNITTFPCHAASFKVSSWYSEITTVEAQWVQRLRHNLKDTDFLSRKG